jgi:FkbM family methyltransferase
VYKLISKLLRWTALRRRIIFALRQDYFEDLGVVATFEYNLLCPIVRQEYWNSFYGVFISEEYVPVFDQIPVPERWLDIGCHAGFFSLLMVMLRRRRKLTGDGKGLLVDGDARVAASVDKIAALNRLGENLKFVHGAISSAEGPVFFEEGFIMSSHVEPGGAAAGKKGRFVPVAKPEELTRLLPGPYDLVKIDAEGGEYDFLTAYQPVLRQTRYLLMEWHSWHPGGGGLEAIRAAARKEGFREIREVVPSQWAGREAATDVCGVLLFESEAHAQGA